MNRWLIGLCALVMAIGGCAHKAATDGGEEKAAKPVVQVAEAVVARGTVRAVLPVTGTLSPLEDQEAKVAPTAPGRIASYYVKTGDLVAKGQVLATLEPGPLAGQREQARAAVSSDAAALQQARFNLRAQERAQRSAVLLARDNLRTQQVALDKLLAGSRPQEIAQTQAAVVSAQAALVQAQAALTRSHTLFGEGLLARKDLEAAEAVEAAARAQVRTAQEALSMAKQGSRPQDIEAGRVAVRQAQDQLRAAEEQGIVNASKAQDVRIAARQLRGAQGALASAQSQVSALTIRAPVAGVVVGRTLNRGEMVDTTGTVATIANLDRVRVLLSVPMAQIGEVRRGQVVEFTVESQPGVTHAATVTVVGRAVDPTTNSVQVEAVALNHGHDLRDDGFVRGVVVTVVHRDVLVVPVGALVDRDGKPTVFVVGSDSVAHARPVVVGIRDGERVEVLSGVALGDHIVTTGAFELEDGTQVKTGQ